MDRVSLRLSEEEKELLRRQAEEAGVSVSELIRDRLFPRELAGTPATFGQVSGLTERVAALAAAVEKLTEKVACDPVPEPVSTSATEARLDEIGLVLKGLAEQLPRSGRNFRGGNNLLQAGLLFSPGTGSEAVYGTKAAGGKHRQL